MLSSAALRAQVASIIGALCKTAVGEIAKVVEDGMVVLRLEMCQRETEIKKLKSNIEVLHTELRAARETETLRAEDVRREEDSQSDAADTNVCADNKEHHSLSSPWVQVKEEPVAERSDEARQHPDQLGEDLGLYEGNCGRWHPSTQIEAEHQNSGYLNVGQNSFLCLPDSSLDVGLAVPCSSSVALQQSSLSRGLLGYSQYRGLCNTARRRTMKRLMFTKGYICPYCGKCFERAGHLERHKRIHTGEKPYRCEICGRRFNQKCSLKEHMKIHRRCIQPRLVEVQVDKQQQIPLMNPNTEAQHSEEERQLKAGNCLPRNQDIVPTPVQVKPEPAEEDITQPLFSGKREQTRDGVDNLSGNFAAYEMDDQQTSRLEGSNNAEMSSAVYVGSSAHTHVTSFPGIAQIIQAPVKASCSTFSLPGKSYGELTNGIISQSPLGTSDNLLISNESGLDGTDEASLNHYRQSTSSDFPMIKPKKCFLCSYCGKVFERSGHLVRHLRIHTGEKPYGCHICGRCFNQKSSLKGHMKTHRNGETTDMPMDTHHLMFTVPDGKLLGNLPETRVAAFKDHIPGSLYSEEQALTVKVEDFHTVSQAQVDNDSPHQRQPLTSGAEESSNATEQSVCVLLHDVKYPSPAAAGAVSEQQGHMSPNNHLLFPDVKDKDTVVLGGAYSILQSRNSDGTVAPELQEPHVAEEVAVVYSPASGRAQQGGVFELHMINSAGHDDATKQNRFICSNCGQSFDSFGLFQRHQC